MAGSYLGGCSFVGVNRRFTPQKCSFRFNDRGSEERFEMRILPATLDTTVCGGHTLDTFLSRQLGDLVRGSKAYRESHKASGGRPTSMNSSGHTVVERAGARSTMARR